MKRVKFGVSGHFGYALRIFLIIIFPFHWNWSCLGVLGIIWRTSGSKCQGGGGGIFRTLCVEFCLVVPQHPRMIFICIKNKNMKLKSRLMICDGKLHHKLQPPLLNRWIVAKRRLNWWGAHLLQWHYTVYYCFPMLYTMPIQTYLWVE